MIEVRAAVGDSLKKGDPLAVLSAMKMETVLASPMHGRVKRVVVHENELVKAGDLVVELETD